VDCKDEPGLDLVWDGNTLAPQNAPTRVDWIRDEAHSEMEKRSRSTLGRRSGLNGASGSHIWLLQATSRSIPK